MKKIALLLLVSFTLLPATLDEIGKKYGTDKASNQGKPEWPGHYYTRVYETYFSKIRYNSLQFLEIGFYRGASARMWEEYFPHARLYFIDNDSNCFTFFQNFSKRTSLHVVDQENSLELTQFIKSTDSEFDIIIDDGGHTMRQQITSLVNLFPYVKSRGIYVIEDLHTSYWPEYQNADGYQGQTTIEFLKKLIDEVNCVGKNTRCANFDILSKEEQNKLRYFQKHIDSIHFYSSLCIIIKK